MLTLLPREKEEAGENTEGQDQFKREDYLLPSRLCGRVSKQQDQKSRPEAVSLLSSRGQPDLDLLCNKSKDILTAGRAKPPMLSDKYSFS